MTLTDLASLGSFVSGVAVLVSLVYLALQVKQATKHTRAQISQNRINRLVDVQLRQAEPDLADIVGRGRWGDETLSPTEIARFMSYARAQFWSTEETFTQHRDGMLADSLFQSLRNSSVGMMRGPGMQAAWDAMRTSFEPAFVAFMDGVAAEARTLGYRLAPADWLASVAKFRTAVHANTTDAAAVTPAPKAAES